MKLLRDLSIKSKLIYIVSISTLFALMLGFTIVVISTTYTFRKDMVSDADLHARLICEYCIAPLSFQDATGVEEIINKVETIPWISNVYVYDSEGELFVQYSKTEDSNPPVLGDEDYLNRFSGNSLYVRRPIIHQNNRLGSIYLRATTDALQKKITNYLLTMVALLVGLMIFTYFVADRLQTVISKPILQLAGVMRIISKEGDYSLRVEKPGSDEIGILFDGFNNMLGQIEFRKKERIKAERALEKSRERFRSLVEASSDWIWEVDKDGKYTYVSPRIHDLLGYNPEEAVGKRPFDFMPFDEAERVAVLFEDAVQRKGIIVGLENINIHKNGQLVVLETNGVPILDEDGNLMGYRGIDRDITNRKLAEKQIQKDLKEKEVLLKEIHHRVKNNLQVISSLLSLQSRFIKDPQALEMFQESKERVRSMALVHEKLYMSKDFASIDFVDYIKSLVGSLYRAYRVNLKKIELIIDINDVSLPVDLAVPCGLVINELVSNTLKHAFPTSYTGKAKLEISMYSKNTDEIELIVKDNGIGIPCGIDFKNGESLGLRLVAILIEDQLRGKIEMERGEGTEFRMIFHKETQ